MDCWEWSSGESKYSASGCMTKVHNYQGGVRGSVGKMLSSSKKKKVFTCQKGIIWYL
ncbi:hypothetical protein TorRG33x02_316430 [Trema orientale]|uniref:Uncharacterized protein n=1 Tax=Trema orientale TaxID=63057 RepID=A0A2P5BLY2_TREOI|nr:hypothetical protein TorRG33x02_316430 [Trema orientale]